KVRAVDEHRNPRDAAVSRHLDLLRGDGLFLSGTRAQESRDRAEMSSRSDEEARLDPAVDDPAGQRPLEIVRSDAVEDARAGAAQQVVVELAAADAVAHRAIPSGLDEALAFDAGPERGDLLERAAARLVVVDVEPQLVDDLWRDPAGARLVARK